VEAPSGLKHEGEADGERWAIHLYSNIFNYYFFSW